MAKLSQITSQTWTLGIASVGSVVQGLDCIRQRLDVVIRTTQGTSPLRPFFGSKVYSFQDRPASVAIPGIKAAILSAVEMWMPEIEVQKITHDIEDDFSLIFYVTYEVIDADITDTLGVSVGSGTITTDVTQLIIQGLFPDNYTSYRLDAVLIRNGSTVLPNMPDTGFSDVDSLFAWITANWGSYGKWVQGSDRIYLYANKTLFTTGSLTISTLAGTMYSYAIPTFSYGQTIHVSLTTSSGILTSESFDNIPSMMEWLAANWSDYGDWSLSGGDWLSGNFNDDFNSDYNSSNYTSQVLNLYSTIEGLAIVVEVD